VAQRMQAIFAIESQYTRTKFKLARPTAMPAFEAHRHRQLGKWGLLGTVTGWPLSCLDRRPEANSGALLQVRPGAEAGFGK